MMNLLLRYDGHKRGKKCRAHFNRVTYITTAVGTTCTSSSSSTCKSPLVTFHVMSTLVSHYEIVLLLDFSGFSVVRHVFQLQFFSGSFTDPDELNAVNSSPNSKFQRISSASVWQTRQRKHALS